MRSVGIPAKTDSQERPARFEEIEAEQTPVPERSVQYKASMSATIELTGVLLCL